jgi:hypothetical protein
VKLNPARKEWPQTSGLYLLDLVVGDAGIQEGLGGSLTTHVYENKNKGRCLLAKKSEDMRRLVLPRAGRVPVPVKKICRSEYFTGVVSQVSGLDELSHADTNNVDFLGRGHCEMRLGALRGERMEMSDCGEEMGRLSALYG